MLLIGTKILLKKRMTIWGMSRSTNKIMFYPFTIKFNTDIIILQNKIVLTTIFGVELV